MTPEERSRRLREEADEVLELIGLRELLEPLGPITPTGSYFLDLMMYPDIDLQVPHTTPERLVSIGVELAKLPCIKKLRYLRGGSGQLKDGFYIKPEIEYGDWGRLWKVDIWSLPSDVTDRQYREMTGLKDRMTAAQRGTILETKYRLLNDQGRTPMFSGIFIYRAVIDEGLTKHAEIVEYLEAHRIEVG